MHERLKPCGDTTALFEAQGPHTDLFFSVVRSEMPYGSNKERLTSPEILDVCGELIVITGSSGSGKTTLAKAVADKIQAIFGKPADRIVTHTTRPPRPHEVDGSDYKFVPSIPDLEDSHQVQQHKISYLETSGHYEARYGTPLEEVMEVLNGACKILLLDPEAAAKIPEQIRNRLSDDPEAAEKLVMATHVIYLGVDRLTQLKDRIWGRLRDGNPNQTISPEAKQKFLMRLEEDWQTWQNLAETFKNEPNFHVIMNTGPIEEIDCVAQAVIEAITAR